MRLLERYHDLIVPLSPPSQAPIVPVDITPSARWFYSESEREHWDVRADFPVAVCPWPRAWLEYVQPTYSRSGDTLTRLPGEVRVGGMFVSVEIPPESRTDPDVFDVTAATYARHVGADPQAMAARRAQIERVLEAGWEFRWLVSVKLWTGSDSGIAEGPAIVYYLDQTGQVVEEFAGVVASGVADAGHIPGVLFPFLFAFSLLHCRNVRVEEAATPRKVAQARRRRGLQPVRFHTLVVDPLRQTVEREPAGSGSGAKRALHIVRGHFADYREKGLFGRYHGIYWREMHVRGDAKAGAVFKDYRVGPKDGPAEG